MNTKGNCCEKCDSGPVLMSHPPQSYCTKKGGCECHQASHTSEGWEKNWRILWPMWGLEIALSKTPSQTRAVEEKIKSFIRDEIARARAEERAKFIQ